MRVVIDLARFGGEAYVPIKSVSEREGISPKYLETIVSLLVKGGILISRRGADGGYKLSRTADKISAGEIIRLTEGRIVSVSCLAGDENTCETAASCLTLPLWVNIDSLINDYLDSITIEDIIARKIEPLNIEF